MWGRGSKAWIWRNKKNYYLKEIYIAILSNLNKIAIAFWMHIACLEKKKEKNRI
jgi:hypothetical protein